MSGGGDETSTQWSLDLDIGDALENVEKFHGALESIGEVESLSGLLETLTGVGLAVGAVGAAVFAVKETFDLVFDAEKIQLVEQAFDNLAEKAGIAGDELKRSMQEAAGGLMSEDELLQSANRGLVELGQNAEHMGQIMTLARQATLVMGGDLKTNFDGIMQAIASGNARALRSMGIIIDQKQAFKDYAASIGVASSELTKAGQQHAMLNAVLAQGAEAFKGVNPSVAEATNNWATFKNTMKDVGDIATLAFEKIAGPAVRAEIGGMSAMAKDAKRWFVDMFGAGAEQAAAHTERLQEKIQSIKGQLIDLEQKKLGHVFDPNPGETQSMYTALEAQLKKYEGELGQSAQVQRKLASDTVKSEQAGTQAVTKNQEVNLQLRAANQLKFENQLNVLREKNLADEKKNATTELQIDRINAQQKQIILQQSFNEKKKIDQQEGLSERQKQQLKVQLDQQATMKIKAIDNAAENDKMTALKNFENENRNSAQGFVAAWSNAGRQASMDVINFAKLGETSINAVSNSFAEGFKAMGNGSKTAGEAMKGALLQALGTIAISEGSLLLLAGIGEFNPVKIAAGGGLIALGGYLEGQAGGGGAAVPAAASVSGDGNSYAQASSGTNSQTSPSGLQQTPQKTVSLTVQGNYYDSNETKTQLMDMIRSATDATDFNYTKVGGK